MEDYQYKFKKYPIVDFPYEYDTLEYEDTTKYTLQYRIIDNVIPLRSNSVTCWIVECPTRIFFSTEEAPIHKRELFLLTFSWNDDFKLTPLNPKNNAKYFTYGRNMLTNFGVFNDSTTWFIYGMCSVESNYSDTNQIYNTEIVTYNIVSGEFNSIQIPLELVELEPKDFSVLAVRQLTHPDGHKLIGILEYRSFFTL